MLFSSKALSVTIIQVSVKGHFLLQKKQMIHRIRFSLEIFAGKPGMLDLKGKAKWNTWNEKKGMSQDEAKEKYIAFVDQLMEKYKE